MFWLHKEDVSVPSKSMYRQRNTYQLVSTKRLKWRKTVLITQKYKNYGIANSTFNNKVKPSGLVFKWNKQKKLWNQTTLAHTKTSKFSLFRKTVYKTLIILHQQPHTWMTRPQLLKQPMNPDKYLTLRTTFWGIVVKFTIMHVITIYQK